jgi:polyisoprenyl-phosphate glycosyltransferase
MFDTVYQKIQQSGSHPALHAKRTEPFWLFSQHARMARFLLSADLVQLLPNYFVWRSKTIASVQGQHKRGIMTEQDDCIIVRRNVISEATFRKENVMTAQETEESTQTIALQTTSHPVTPVYSVVAPVFNEEETLPHFYRALVDIMEKIGESFELVLINDGSRDRSFSIMQDLHKNDSRVRVVNFSRNFGHQIAISAGLDHARGQAIIIMDADLQDPPTVIPDLVARWRDGVEVVYAQRARRLGETRFKLFTASIFYRLIKRITSVNIPQDTGDFRLLDRHVVDVLVKMREQHRFMRGLSAWVGFRQEAVQYDRQERFAGETKYPLNKMIHFSLDAITSFSHVPLELAATLGFFLAGISLVGIVVAAILRIFTRAIVGQASTLILVLFMGGIQLIFLGIIGEYLGRIYDEVRARPLYIVREILE